MSVDGPHDQDAPVGRLVDLVDYQHESIVSKILSKSDAGSVTLFAFGAGQELSEHTAPFEALVQILDGAAEIGIGGEKHDATAGDLVRLPANVPHWVKAVGSFKMMLTMLRHHED